MTKVEHIYREASKLFARRGFEGVGMRDVAQACGITLATLYYHFSSKGELHDEITQFRFEEFIYGLSAKQKAQPPQEDTPSALLGLIFDAVLADPTLFNLMQHDLHHFEPGSRHAHSRDRYRAFLDLIRNTATRHAGRTADESTVIALAAIITGYCELMQADARSAGPERETFVLAQRSAMMALVRRTYE